MTSVAGYTDDSRQFVERDNMDWYFRSSNPTSIEYLVSVDRMLQSYFDLLLKKAVSGEDYSDIAMFSCFDRKTNMDTVYFSPSAESIAKIWAAVPCEKPVPVDGFSKLVGDSRAWQIHFPEYAGKFRSQTRTD